MGDGNEAGRKGTHLGRGEKERWMGKRERTVIGACGTVPLINEPQDHSPEMSAE